MKKSITSKTPKVSIIIPTYNSEKTLRLCLESIVRQKYPRDRMEILIVDGGSRDGTLDIAKSFGVEKILHNPYVGQELGKAMGLDNAEGQLIALIDSDNVLPEKDWMRKMIRPLIENRDVVGSEPMMFTYRRDDPSVVRYCSLIGCDDPLPYMLGNRDKWSWAKMSWTDVSLKTVEDRGPYIIVELEGGKRIPTLGANGFVTKTHVLKNTRHRPYIDIDVVYNMVQSGHTKYAKVKTSIIHLHANKLTQYLKKKYRRATIHYLYKKYRTYPWQASERELTRIAFQTITVIPQLKEVLRGYRRKPDKAWLLHPIACFVTMTIYGIIRVRHRL